MSTNYSKTTDPSHHLSCLPDTNEPDKKNYITPKISILRLNNIQGGSLTPILEGDGGLLTS